MSELESPADCRPISPLPILSTVYEKVYEYSITNNNFYKK